MRKTLLVVLIAACTMLISACSTQASQLSSAEQSQVEIYSEPAVDNLMAAMKNDDFNAFSRDFDSTFRLAMDLTRFTNLLQKLNDQLGSCSSRTISQMTNKNNMVVVDYSLTCVKVQSVKLEVTFHPDSPHQIAGVGFLSPGF